MKPRMGHLGPDAAIKLIDAYLAADDDADIEIRMGEAAEFPGQTFVAVIIGDLVVGLTPTDALALASIAEDAMNRFPAERDAQSLPNLIMGLRMGAAKAEQRSAE